MVLAVTTTMLVLLFFLILTCVQSSPQTETSLSSHEMTKDISCCGSKGVLFENTYFLTQLITLRKSFIFYNLVTVTFFVIGPENISIRCPNGREGPGDVIIGNSCLRLVIFLIVVCLVSCCTIVVLVGNYILVEMWASVFFLTWYVIFSKCSLYHFPWESRLVITIRERTEP